MNTVAELGRGLCYSIFVQTTIINIQWRLNPFNPLFKSWGGMSGAKRQKKTGRAPSLFCSTSAINSLWWALSWWTV